MLKLSGRPPRDLGVADGRFTAARTWKPNWVSSQVDPADSHYVAPLAGSLAQVETAIARMPRVRVIERKPGYLYAQFSTALMGFVDDVEFLADGTVVQVRSSSRLGIRDFGVNRQRVEAIRAGLAQ